MRPKLTTDFRVRTDIFTHWKLSELHERHGDHGVLTLFRLWCATAQHKPTGHWKIDKARLLRQVRQTGGWEVAPEVIDTLIELELLDPGDDGFTVHNWIHRQPFVVNPQYLGTIPKPANIKNRKHHPSSVTHERDSHPGDPPGDPGAAQPKSTGRPGDPQQKPGDFPHPPNHPNSTTLEGIPSPSVGDRYRVADLAVVGRSQGWRTYKLRPNQREQIEQACIEAGGWTLAEMIWAVDATNEKPTPTVVMLALKLGDAVAGREAPAKRNHRKLPPAPSKPVESTAEKNRKAWDALAGDLGMPSMTLNQLDELGSGSPPDTETRAAVQEYQAAHKRPTWEGYRKWAKARADKAAAAALAEMKKRFDRGAA